MNAKSTARTPEREQFEKWGNAKGAHVEKSWNGEYYENRLVESAWQGWQAGREGLLEALADAIKYANAAANVLDDIGPPPYSMSELWEKVKRAEALLGTEKERKS